jgi:lysozyme family protein
MRAFCLMHTTPALYCAYKPTLMAKISFTPELQASYQRLFDTCIIAADKYPQVDAAVKTILAGKKRYETVSAVTTVPWYFIGIAHYMEGGSNFTKHLHNGDPLTARTTHVPKGRPATGNPPFSWEVSAEDALTYTGVNKWTNWSVPGLLYKLEGYNGFGYRRASININSPYLWSFSNHYTKGKFVLDGTYSATAVSKQCGAAVILRRLMEKKEITIGATVSRTDAIIELGKEVAYAPSRYSAKAEELQKILNLNGAYLKPDGKAGKLTSDAYFAVAKKYLNGDPRA